MEPVVATVHEHLKAIHDGYRETVRGMSKEALAWTPGPETNSAAALVVHMAGSEGDHMQTIRGMIGPRDRDAEFRATAESDEDLLRLLDEADAFLDETTAAITAEDLASMRERRTGAVNTGLYWLVQAATHAREHLAHLQLTKQLYEQQHGK